LDLIHKSSESQQNSSTINSDHVTTNGVTS